MDYAISSNGGKLLHEFYCYCTVLGIVTTVVSSIDSLDGEMHKFSNKRSSIALWKKYDVRRFAQ